MSKALRPHAPGCVFHITARTQGKQPWFTDSLKTAVQMEIMEAARSSGMLLLAQVIMSNHFHIVLRQNAQPLAYMMHRVMHRAALILKRAHCLEGHVFGRRYWTNLCATSDYVRRAIIYTHLNPCRAGLNADPAAYQWSSHAHYLNADADVDHPVARVEGLRFFATSDSCATIDQYMAHVRSQLSVDAYVRGEVTAREVHGAPACQAGDSHWDQSYQAALHLAARITPRQPVYDVAVRLLEQLDRSCSIDLLRTGVRAPKLVMLRRNLVASLLTAGYRGTQIARLLGTSTSYVSKIAISLTT
jgi:REP element-mobilizing transposase RayT